MTSKSVAQDVARSPSTRMAVQLEVGLVLAGVKLLACTHEDRRASKSVWEVEYQCCGMRKEMTREDLLRRRYYKRQQCTTCANGKRRPSLWDVQHERVSFNDGNGLLAAFEQWERSVWGARP